uniref:Uncharacterized protein n=1 Tax=Anguilla anguilla TaxID=7936 RepID=A0A0E9V3P9_ANGAN
MLKEENVGTIHMRAYVTSDQKIQSLFSLHLLYCKYLKFCRLFIHSE